MYGKLLLVFLLTVVICPDPPKAYCTYHLYYKTEPLTTVACSDGAYGLIGWGYTNLEPMFPYVAAWNELSWNNPKCGTCIALSYGNKTIHITALDQCGAGQNGTTTHFDISKEAFTEIFGQEGINKGSMMANWTIANHTLCKGNRKKNAEQPNLVSE